MRKSKGEAAGKSKSKGKGEGEIGESGRGSCRGREEVKKRKTERETK